MDSGNSEQNPNQAQAAQEEENDVAMLDDAPMGSDHDAESQEGDDAEDFVIVDDNEMA